MAGVSRDSLRSMPLPPTLISTYRQYKNDTDVVASWLAHTGQRLGCPDALLSNKTVQAGGKAGGSSSRLKGKGRKKAKAAAAAVSGPTAGTPEPSASSAPKPKYVLAIRNFLPLAQFIGSSEIDEYKVDVPDTFTAAIERAISVRRAFAILLEKHGATLGMGDDAKHSFFVGVLEKVRDVLRPLFWKSAEAAKGKKSSGGLGNLSSVADALPKTTAVDFTTNNPFEILKVYDTPEADLSVDDLQADASQPPTAEDKNSVITVDYVAEDSGEEKALEGFLAFFTLFRDLTALRTRVKSLWASYAKKELSLSSVSVVTNTAVDLARRLEEDVAHLLKPKKGGMHDLLYNFYLVACDLQGADSLKKLRPEDSFNMNMYSLLDYTMSNSAMLIKGWSDIDPDGLVTYNGQFGWYDIDIDYDSASNRVKWNQDRAELTGVLPDFDRMGRFSTNPPPKSAGFRGQLTVLDEMTRGLHEMMASSSHPAHRQPSLWLILATSIHLDIRRVLKKDIERPYMEMCVINDQAYESIQKTLDYHKDLRIVGWTAQSHATLRRVQDDIHFWRKNLVTWLMEITEMPYEKDLFLKRHPWYCGLWVHDLRARLHHIGVAFNHAWGGILYAGHLYNALQQEKLVGHKWEDMELFYRLQGGRDKFFVGAAPTDAALYHKQLCMVMGFSAANFTPQPNKRNKGKLQRTAAGPRSLQQQGRVSMMWMVKWHPASSRVNLTAEDVQAILEVGESSSSRPKNNKKNASVTTPVELITDLAYAIQKEIPEIAADYLSMHRTCWDLLRLVKDAVHGDMLGWIGPDYIEGEYQLPFIVGWFFRSVCGELGDGKKIPTMMPTMELLRKAARVYNEDMGKKFGEVWYRTEMQNMRKMASEVDRAMRVPEI